MRKAIVISILIIFQTSIISFAQSSNANIYDYYLRAHCNAKQGNLFKAIELMEKVIFLDPQAIEPKTDIVKMYQKQAESFKNELKFDNAIEALETAFKYDPHNFITFRRLYVLYLKTNNLNNTLNLFRSAINNIPAATEDAVLIGKILISKNKYQSACKFFEIAINSKFFMESETAYNSTRDIVNTVLDKYPNSPLYNNLLNILEHRAAKSSH